MGLLDWPPPSHHVTRIVGLLAPGGPHNHGLFPSPRATFPSSPVTPILGRRVCICRPFVVLRDFLAVSRDHRGTTQHAQPLLREPFEQPRRLVGQDVGVDVQRYGLAPVAHSLCDFRDRPARLHPKAPVPMPEVGPPPGNAQGHRFTHRRPAVRFWRVSGCRLGGRPVGPFRLLALERDLGTPGEASPSATVSSLFRCGSRARSGRTSGRAASRPPWLSGRCVGVILSPR